ncbi:hypothetical protein KR018_005797, partial [Drosophila ironensis]
FYATGVFYKIKKSECIVNQEYIDNVSCVLKPISWTRSEISMDCDLKVNLTDIKMVVDVFYKDSSNMYHPFAVKFTFDICHLLRGKEMNFLEKYAKEHFLNMTNLNHSCPIVGHVYARKFRLDETWFPHLPLQTYKIRFHFSNGKPARYLGVVWIYIEVMEDYYKNRRPRPKALMGL